MKIAFLITRTNAVGGAAIHVRDLALRLKADGHVPIVATGGEGVYTTMLRDDGIDVHPLKWLRMPVHPVADLRGVAEVRGFLRDFQPALLATHSSKAGVIGRISARSLGLPAVFTAHGWSFTNGVPGGRRAIYRAIERMTAGLSSRVIAVSEFDRQLAVQAGVVARQNIVTIRNGMPDVPPSERAEPGAAPPRLVMVARFENQKDHETLLRSLAALADLEWSCQLVGDGPNMPRMQALAARLGIAGRVEFAGYRADVSAVLRAAQIFVLATNWEGLPLTILEAMRAGLPVVASDVGGVAEQIDEGRTGHLVPPRDPEALALRLRPLIQDAGLRTRFGREGRHKYETEFTFEQMYARTLAVYMQVVGRS